MKQPIIILGIIFLSLLNMVVAHAQYSDPYTSPVPIYIPQTPPAAPPILPFADTISTPVIMPPMPTLDYTPSTPPPDSSEIQSPISNTITPLTPPAYPISPLPTAPTLPPANMNDITNPTN